MQQKLMKRFSLRERWGRSCWKSETLGPHHLRPPQPHDASAILTATPTGGTHMAESSGAIESSMQEDRVFAPPPDFSRHAHIKTREEYDRLYRESIDRPEEFW